MLKPLLPKHTTTRPAKTALMLALSVLLLAFALRIHQLGAQSVWFDEGWSWNLARMPLGEMASVTAADRSPALYYALLHGWIDLTGDSEFAMRYLSLLADVLCVALVIAFGRAISRSSPYSAVLAGVLYAICPFAIWYAQETRMYAQVAALGMASAYWLWRWLRVTDTRRYLTTSAVLLLLAIYSHYYAIFMLPAMGVAVLAVVWLRFGARDWRMTLRVVLTWVLAATGVIVMLLPWLIFASAGFAYDDGFSFPLNTVGGRMLEWLTAFAGGGLARQPESWWIVALGVAVLCGIGSMLLARRWRALTFLLALVVGSLLTATLAVRVVYPYRSVFHPRYLIYIAPLLCVLCSGVGGAVARRWLARSWRIMAVVVLAMVWLPALTAIYTDARLARDDVRGALRHVVEALQPGDLVVMTRDNYAVRYYLQRQYSAHQDAFVAVPAGLHGVLKSDASIMRLLTERQPTRVRLFLWQDDVVDPQKLLESTLWANGYELGEVDFGQMRLPLYQLQRTPAQALHMQDISATFGDALDLRAYWMRDAARAGDWFYVVLAWQPRIRLPVSYKVFVHVWDSSGRVVFQEDKLALNDRMPMTSWGSNETLHDPYAMVIPASLPAGEYRVAVGLYDPASKGQRLRATSTSNVVLNDAVILATLRVRAR